MRQHSARLNPDPVSATVENLSHDGRGVARIDGKATFIAGALPGEQVVFRYRRKHRDFDEGVLESVGVASPDRNEPSCPHYTLCGGCALQHLSPQAQIREKEAQLLDLMARTGRVEPREILPALQEDAWNYRTRARLSVRFVEKKGATLTGFRERHNPRYITDITSCAILDKRVDSGIVSFRALLDSLDNPRNIAQIEVAAADNATALVFRNLEPLSAEDETRLRAFAEREGFEVYLQPAGPGSIYLLAASANPVPLQYHLPDFNLVFTFEPSDFTQVNPALNRRMVAQALDWLNLAEADCVLDLYCGLGNFSLPLATRAGFVLGVEGSETMVSRASANAAANRIENAQFLARDLDAQGVLQTLPEKPFSKMLLDPPRTGALEVVRDIDCIRPERIVYISCNPATLARDAGVLVHEKGYTLLACGVMDMFPHTAHTESMAVFQYAKKR